MRWRRSDGNITMTPQTLALLIFTLVDIWHYNRPLTLACPAKAPAVKAHITITNGELGLLHTCEANRRTAHRRKDVSETLFIPQPTPESLQRFAQATGAAGFEAFTEGKSLVKRLIPANSQPDLDVVEYQGVIGKAGIDFPALPNIPNTGFNCKNVPTGYYADLETACQVFHICDTSRKISFLCPNGTIFSQSHLICDWWFKVDCAAAPTLYEASVEYYSNEQKKSQRISHNLKNLDLQQIGTDTNERAESRRTSVNVPSTTERLLRHKQKLQTDGPLPNAKATARSYQALFDTNPTQRAQATTAFEKRRKNLVQLIGNNFGGTPSRTTYPTYDITTRKAPALNPDNSPKEMQVVAETASFVNNQNRQFLQDYNSKNLRPYAVYTPNLPSKLQKPKSTLTTLYDIQAQPISQYVEEASTKRQTLVPYTKSYTSEKREPYTRPGVSLLRDFLEREKNKTTYETTEKIPGATARSDKFNQDNRVLIETKSSFESATKIPQTTRNNEIAEVSSSDSVSTYSTAAPAIQTAATPSYQERRERLLHKLDFEPFASIESTTANANTEKYYGDLPNRPGLVVPPSLTPKTLHSFAIYYATALDNLSTTTPTEDNDVTTPAIDEYEPLNDKLSGLFSRQTINKYSNLFGQSANGEIQEMKLDANETYNELVEDLSLQMSQTPLASSPQIRELAQVFTHALSAYLQDPVKFRKVLSDIRPTHPTFDDMIITTDEAVNTEPTTTINEDDHEILGFSDDHKDRFQDTSLRSGKALNIASDYTTFEEQLTTTKPTTTESLSKSYSPTSPRNPFKCCGRISASYTTAPSVTPNSFANIQTNKFNAGGKTDDFNSVSDSEGTAKTIDEYFEVTNLPSAWDGEKFDSTLSPITNSHQMFESKKIKVTYTITDTTPSYFPEDDSIELENEEELQRAHSQSFVSPQSNSLRQGKQLTPEDKKALRKPSEDLEAPTQAPIETTTTQVTTVTPTTTKEQNEGLTTESPIVSSIFTSPDSDKPFSEFQWSTPLENWQSTGIDPMTLNEGLSATGPDQGIPEITHYSTWPSTSSPVPTDFTATIEPAVSSTISIESTSPGNSFESRFGKFLRDPTSTEPGQDLTTITDTVVEKAKEIMEGMNATTTQKLMNVMKKTKSKTVKRLILLLVQTCDDDHNKTAEASKKALLDALMAVSQKDMEEIANEDLVTETPTTVDIKTTEYYRRSDRFAPEGRRGKSLNIDADAINSLSIPTTTEAKTEEPETTTTYRTTTPSRRGGKRFQTRTEPTTTEKPTTADAPVAAARIAVQEDVKAQSDTRALELLRSLYTIAARWG